MNSRARAIPNRNSWLKATTPKADLQELFELAIETTNADLSCAKAQVNPQLNYNMVGANPGSLGKLFRDVGQESRR